MKVFLSLIVWRLRGRRQVRLQLNNEKGAVDGILIGITKGHYILRNSAFIANTPKPEPEPMLGETWVPKERVLLLNVKLRND